MPQFSYKARRKSDEVVQGVLDVADRPAALLQIERLGLFPVMVEGARGGAAAAAAGAGEKDGAKRSVLPASFQRKRQRKPKLQEMATFTQQLANLLNSGMPLTVALSTYQRSLTLPAMVVERPGHSQIYITAPLTGTFCDKVS